MICLPPSLARVVAALTTTHRWPALPARPLAATGLLLSGLLLSSLPAQTTITAGNQALLAGWDFDNILTGTLPSSPVRARYSDVFGNNSSPTALTAPGGIYFDGQFGSDNWGSVSKNNTGDVNRDILTRAGSGSTFDLGGQTGGEGAANFNNASTGTAGMNEFSINLHMADAVNSFEKLSLSLWGRDPANTAGGATINWYYSTDGGVTKVDTTLKTTFIGNVFVNAIVDFSAVTALNKVAELYLIGLVVESESAVQLNLDNIGAYAYALAVSQGLTFWKGGDGVWDKSTTNWLDAVNSSNPAEKWGGGLATFGGTAGTVTVDTAGGDVVFTGAKFLTTGYTVAGAGLKTTTAATTLEAGTGITATISAPITGTGGLDKTDLGTVVLSGANTYAGTTTITAGKLAINGAQTGTGAVTVKTGGTLTGTGSTAGAVTVENGGTLAGTTGSTFTMAGLTLSPSAALNVTLGAPNTAGPSLFQVNGALTLDGTLNVAATAGFSNGLYRLIDFTGTLTNNTLEIGSVPGAATDFLVKTDTANQVNLLVDSTSLFWAGGTGSWTAAGAGWKNAGNVAVNYSPNFAIFNGATGTVTVESGGVEFRGAQFVTDGYAVNGGPLNTTTTAVRDVRVDAGKTATIGAAITGTGGLRKVDGGTLVLSGTNTHTGGTTVSEGTLQLGAGGATGSVAGNITNNAALVFDLTGTPTYAGVISGTGTVKKQGAATLALTGANTYTGNTTVSAGTLSIGSGGTAGSIAGNATVESGGTLAFNRSDASTYAGNINGAGAVTKLGTGTLSLTGASTHTGVTTVSAGTLSVGAGGTTGSLTGNITNSATVAFNRSNDSTYAGVISGTGAVTKLGAGTTTLSGANAYTGATTVSAGKLLINGSQLTATGAITVASGAALGGSGTTGGVVTVAAGGSLVGTSGSTFTMAGLILADTSKLDVTLGTAGATPLFQVNGNLTLDGILNITGTPAFGDGLYRLFNYTGTLVDNKVVVGTAPGGTGSYKIQTDTLNQVSVLSSVSSAPTVWAGGGGTWTAATTGTGWGDSKGAWQAGTALFQGLGDVITVVSTTTAPVVIKGILFQGDEYVIDGTALTNNTSNATFRVGDGTAAGASMTAVVKAPIIGTGGIDKTDFGTLVLSGVNTYTGGTRISSGVLEVADDKALGATTGILRFNGGTLRAGANLTSARSVTLSAGGGTVDSGGNAVTLSGILSGSGNLTKRGTGSLTVSGANTNTGTTTVSEGTLILKDSSLGATTVSAGARLTGTGSIRGNLTNGGTLSPGASPGTITIVGNFTQSAGGTYAAEIASATSYDKLVVSEKATVGGTLTVTGLNGFVPGTGQTFKIIEAAGGVSGTFATIVSPWSQLSVMRKFQAFYGPNDVSLGFLQLPYASVSGATANQKAIGKAVDGALADGKIPTLSGTLNGLATTAAVLTALEQLSPQRYERWFEQGVYQAAATMRLAENHMTARAGTRRKDVDPQGGLWLEMVRRETRFDENQAEGSATARASSDGIVVGGDMPLSRLWQLGALFGYTNETLQLDSAGSSTAAERFNAALYARLNTALFMEAVAGMNYAKLDSTRTVAADAANPVVAESKVDSGERYLGLRTGFPFRLGATRMTPYLAMNYVRWSADEATESGAGDANLTLSSQSADSLTSRTGLAVAWPFSGKKVTVTPRLDLAWWHEFRGDPRTIGASLGGNLFTIQTRTPSTSGVTAGFGLDAAFGSRFTAYARFASEWATTVDESLEARAGVDYRF